MKKLKIVSIIFFVLAPIFFVVGFVPMFYPAFTENNTTEFEATFISFEIENNSTIIKTSEFQTKLIIANNKQILDMSHLESLQQGTTIHFRVGNDFIEDITTSEFTYIVSLKTDTADIVTLDSFNKDYLGTGKQGQIMSFTASGIFLLIAVVSLYFYLSKKKQIPKNPNNIN